MKHASRTIFTIKTRPLNKKKILSIQIQLYKRLIYIKYVKYLYDMTKKNVYIWFEI